MLNAEKIKECARNVGFDLCGVAPAVPMVHERAVFEQWLASTGCGGLDYLQRNISMRFDAAEIVEGARSVIVCAVSYKNDTSLGFGTSDCPKVASFARNADYHLTIRNMLRRLAGLLDLKGQGIGFRAFCDSAPVAEKSWAVRAGIGWIGRNSLLVTRSHGSFIHLGELICSDVTDCYDDPITEDMCYGCKRCLLRCPNRSILDNRRIDVSRCVSRMTIESDAYRAADDLHGWIFGCDECQSVCPYNIIAPDAANGAFAPLFDPRMMDADEWRGLSDEEFASRFGSTALVRCGIERLKKNLL